MDNLAHSLVGIAAAKAGLERLSPATPSVCLLAANAPDLDILSLVFGDRWTYLHHHRGITHSIVGTFVLALAIPLTFFLVERMFARIRGRKPRIKLVPLTIASLIVSATHPFMDWTNNYGIRPFLPWNPKWFYGDLVFIVDPFIWMMIGSAAFLLTSKSKKQIVFWLLLGSIVTFIVLFAAGRPGVTNLGWIRAFWLSSIVVLIIAFRLRLAERWGSRIAIVAFGVLLTYWGSLALIHWQALRQARQEALAISSTYGETVTDVAAMPTLANPLHWQVVVETELAAYRFELFLTARQRPFKLVRHTRPDAVPLPVVGKALEERPARVFLEFARFPVMSVEGADCATQTLVQLADLRYTEPGSQRGAFSVEIPVECPVESLGQSSIDGRDKTDIHP